MPTMIFEISPDTRALAERLKLVPYGALISYAELAAVIGRDVRKCRHLLYSAFAIIREETGAAFGVVIREGYQRITVEQVPALGGTARKRIRRTARQTTKKINAALAKSNDVPNDVRLKANAELSVLGLIEVMSRDSNVKPSPDMNEPQPVAVAAKMFLNRIGGG